MNSLKLSLYMKYRGRFSSNAEANASALLENLQEVISRY